jgi:tRNA threonylcarbamoyladenosine biosynthesis protein TsaE
MRKTYLTISPSKTKKIGEVLAKKFLRLGKIKNKLKEKALVIGLEGDLGGGKTTFLQGFAKGLEIKEKILSPTFVVIKKFLISSGRRGSGVQFLNFYHIDCYRIGKPKEILDLGFKKIISNPQNVVAIEWADRIRKILPKKAIIIKFEFVGKTTRKISLINGEQFFLLFKINGRW